MSSSYSPDTDNILFALSHVIGVDNLTGMEDLNDTDLKMILDGAAQFAADAIAPVNHPADEIGNSFDDGDIKTPPAMREAYQDFVAAGWNSVPFPPEYGGQGLPWTVAFALQEMWQAASLSFGLCPLLTQGAVEAIDNHGSEEQKQTYLEKMISGVWTGTMNLTEPQAGSDLRDLKTIAEPQDDGTYRLKGQKIYITYGEHDFSENIIHLVLARTPDAPAGTKGISMFIVPKFIPDDEGAPGKRNDVKCVSMEHKLGIHASPTCTMQYGDEGGAVAYLVGEEHKGLKYMFTMMNNARLSVGLQGVGVSSRAYQMALAYARERKQGTRLGGDPDETVAIVEHPDVRRMLLEMKALTEAGRLLTYDAVKAMDMARSGDESAQGTVDLLTPVVKSWCTDMSVVITSLGIQVHGGMGYIEEMGAAQLLRDARILPIYEGSNGIQALDLSIRKLLMDEGERFFAWCENSRDLLKALNDPDLVSPVEKALDTLEQAGRHILETGKAGKLESVGAVSVPFLEAFGYVAGAVMLVRAASVSQNKADGQMFADEFLHDRAETAAFYIAAILPRHASSCEAVLSASGSIVGYKGF